MQIELKNGRRQTTEGKNWHELEAVEKLLFGILLKVELIISKLK